MEFFRRHQKAIILIIAITFIAWTVGLMMIPLENGDNNIEMTYSTPYIKLGIIATIFGIICLILVIINENKCKKQL